MILYYFVEFAGSFANIALLLLFIGRLFPKKELVSKWFYVYVVLIHFLIRSSQEQNRHVGCAPHLLAEIEARAIRQGNILHHQVIFSV